MAARSTRMTAALVAALIVFLARPGRAQLVLGQYEEEAPYRTWNSFPFRSAAALGRGETAFASAGDAAAFLANPGLLLSLPGFGFSLGASLQTASFFKYGPVNTGVLETEDPVPLTLTAFDFAGLTVSLGRCAVGGSVNLTEIYDRPTADYVSKPRDVVLYHIRFEQTGILRDFNLSVGYRLGPGLCAGVGLNFVTGREERHLLEKWASPEITITDDKTFRFRGFYLNGGLYWEASPRLHLAAIFRTPYVKKAEAESRVRYQAPAGPTDIAIDGQADDKLRQPLVSGVGINYELFSRFRIGADVAAILWSSYEVTWFGEKQVREFAGVVKAAIGAEYVIRLGLFGERTEIPLRAGLSYDRQPMRNPASAYLGYTVGTGIRQGGFVIDIGLLLARESGSGNDLTANRAALSLGYGF